MSGYGPSPSFLVTTISSKANANKPLPPMPRLEDEQNSWIEASNTGHAYGRPRAQTHLNTPSTDASHWTPNTFILDTPVSSHPPKQPYHLLRSASEGEHAEVCHPPPVSRPSQSMHLPDPSQFPDPYPFNHHITSTPPGLSSADSSSASTRSSAYGSTGSALASIDYSHVHVVSGDEDGAVGVGITSDSVVQLLANDSMNTSASSVQSSRMPVERTRWSEAYSPGVRSRSSSVGTSSYQGEHVSPRLKHKVSYDVTWQTVDEKDEVGVSESETDDALYEDEDSDEEHRLQEERTSAAVMAEEGRGLIVHGDGLPMNELHVQPDTTHLLVGSSSTPNAMPSFLTNTIPPISLSLLALDISANFLGALPPVLAMCTNLEELNIASNPLRVLPVFLADLVNLRVFIADSTGISTLPDTLADLDKLHTISIRRNKLNALPSWLCLLPALQALFIDGNPFQGPWKALVEPLLAKIPMTPSYPPSTPMFPLPSASNSSVDTETELTDLEEFESPSSGPAIQSVNLEEEEEEEEEEDHTVMPSRSPIRNQGGYPDVLQSSRPLTRTRTTPNKSFYISSRASSAASQVPDQLLPNAGPLSNGVLSNGSREMRRMKSAGELRKGRPTDLPSFSPRPGMVNYPTSLSSSNLLNLGMGSPERPVPKRFVTAGPYAPMGSPYRSPGQTPFRQPIRDNHSGNGDEYGISGPSTRKSVHDSAASPMPQEDDGKSTAKSRYTKEGKEKGKRWGFLKKMSMGKMKPDLPSTRLPSAPMPSGASSIGSSLRRPPPQSLADRQSNLPQINMRFSTTGSLDVVSHGSPPEIEIQPDILEDNEIETTVTNASMLLSPPLTPNFLAPPSPVIRSTRRRSFLPIDTPFAVHIPDAAAFVPGVTVTSEDDASERIPSPTIHMEQIIRKEEERAKEGYMRALRSVMAYLKDMNDLGLSQQASTMSMYGNGPDDSPAPRSRRPTVVDSPRELSVADSQMLRNSDSINGLRSYTMSMASTTDSNGSGEERKFKNDKGKRAMVMKEIVVTERTYVKGLQELVDIYIKPSHVQNTVLSASSKDTIVPAPERKVVFGGIDALYSFHKHSFLPALEAAIGPLMNGPIDNDADPDGQQSANLARAIGNIFLKHAAFMKMYSSYINNFDNAVQRVKYWTSDRSTGSPNGNGSASSSTVQLVNLGLTIGSAVAGSNGMADSSSVNAGLPVLSTSQRKRIKSYMKRCRMNPRHSQLNLEGYLLLPVQRIPRYRMLLEELLRSTPPMFDYMDDPLDRSLAEISSLANNMNEGKREAESRRKLVQWQSRIRGKFPSPLVQPHRRLIMDGPLLLTRVVRKAVVSFESINAQGDASTVQVDCLAPELTPRPLIGILCNDLLVLCRDPSEGKDPASHVDLWAVLRMQTLPQPASIVHGNSLRLVDNKAILYFDAPTPSDALNWYRAINLHIPASKT